MVMLMGRMMVRVTGRMMVRVVARSTRDLLEGYGFEVDRGLEFPRSRLHLEETLGEVGASDNHNFLPEICIMFVKKKCGYLSLGKHPIWWYPRRLIIRVVKLTIITLIKAILVII